MHVDRLVPPGLAQQRHDALGLAERISAHDVGALGKQRLGGQQPVDLAGRGRMAEHRQPEGGFGDECVAAQHLERRAGGVACSLVVPRNHHGETAGHDPDLCRSQDVAGGVKRHRDPAYGDVFAWNGNLRRACKIRTVTRRHDGKRLGRCQHGGMAGARVVAVSVRN